MSSIPVRKIGRWTLRLLIVVLVLYLSRSLWLGFLIDVFSLSVPRGFRAGATSSFVYRLEGKSQRPLVFSFPPCKKLRLITNAVVPVEQKPAPGVSFATAILYEVLDAKSQVLLTKEYHQSATLTQYRDPQTGESFIDGSFPREDEIPMDGKMILINFKGLKTTPRRIRLYLISKEPPVNRVFVRVYWERQFPGYKRETVWKRTTRETKVHLGRGNIYPVDLLSEAEKKHLAAVKWEVLSPLGVPGKDFHREILYTLKENTGIPIYPQGKWSGVSPGELYIHAGHKGVVPLPEEGGHFRFVFSALPPGLSPGSVGAADAGGALQLTWYGRRAGHTLSMSTPWRPPTTIFEKSLPGGMVEITAPAEMTVKVFQLPVDRDAPLSPESHKIKQNLLRGGGGFLEKAPPGQRRQEKDITPGPQYLRTYRCDRDQPLFYRVHHQPGEAVPFRFDLRCLSPCSSSPRITYEFLDQRDKIIQTGSLSVGRAPSFYDRPPGAHAVVSEKVSHYFLLSSRVSGFRFSNNGDPVLVTVYNRPFKLVKQVRVPGDYYAFNRGRDFRRDWFYLRPANLETLVQRNKAFSLVVQPRPPQVDDDIRSGRYRWDLFYPLTPTRARMLLVKRESYLPLREQARAALFRGLPVGKEISLVFRDERENPTTAKLVFLKTGKNICNPCKIVFFLAGRRHWEASIYGRSGDIPVTPITTGFHKVRLETPPGIRLFINKTDASQGDLYYQRLAYVMDSRPLSFQYHKASPGENLSFRLFAPFGATKEVSLEVKVSGIKRHTDIPFKNWTLGHRVYSVRPAGKESEPVPVLRTLNQKVDKGESLFLPLGEDVPTGIYNINLRFKGPKGYYLLIYRVVPGSFEDNRIDIRGVLNVP